MYIIEKLISAGLVDRKRCITDEKNKKKTRYVLNDNMFRFWYRFIPGAVSVIEMGKGELYYSNVVKPLLRSYMGPVFEEMCRHYTLRKGIQGAFDCFLTSVGTWWGIENIKAEGGTKPQSADIDVVGIAEGERKAVVGECKFRNEKIDMSIYETLIRKSSLISGKYRIAKYLFFSLSGYTDWFENIRDEDVLLLTLDSLYE